MLIVEQYCFAAVFIEIVDIFVGNLFGEDHSFLVAVGYKLIQSYCEQRWIAQTDSFHINYYFN